MANLKDLIVNGASRFIGKVFINNSTIGVINNSTVGDYPKFTDTTYTQVTTAAAGLSPKLSGSATQYLNGSGTWTTPTNTTYADVTTSAHGLMTAADKIKLNAISTTDNNTTYSISMSGNVITLTGSAGAASSVTLPVYNGETRGMPT